MSRFAKPARVMIVVCTIVTGGRGESFAVHGQEAADASQNAAEGVPSTAPATSPYPTNVPATSGNRTYQPDETTDFILPPDRSYLTKEERKRLMETPGLKYVRRGPKGTLQYNMVRYILQPWDDHQFGVNFWIEDRMMLLEEVELDAEVGRKLKAERPENPGRARSFPVWATVEQPGAPSIPLFQSGWFMTVQKVQRFGVDGWKAWGTVQPIVRDEYYEQAQAVLDSHEEVYLYQDGKLRLEAERPDPNRTSDPMKGVRAWFKGRDAPVPAVPDHVVPKPAA